jgi:uncharacterized protein
MTTTETTPVDPASPQAPRELSREECWDHLREHDFGRIGVAPGGYIGIYPVNYVVEQGRIMIRTSPGSKLTALLLNDRVAFEVDGRVGDVAWSVLVRGVGEEVEMPPKEPLPNTTDRPWVPGPRHAVVEIRPVEITGRHFHRGADAVPMPDPPGAAAQD